MAASTRAPGGEVDFAALRRSDPVEPIAAETIQWLASLPANVRPRLLPTQFTRIANTLCRRWPIRNSCLAYFDELLIDRRGNRPGFPIGIVFELAALKNFFETVVHRAPQTVWDEVSNRLRAE